MDGALIDAWASHKSFHAKDGDDQGSGSGGREKDFHDEKSSTKTHCSTTNCDAELMKKEKKHLVGSGDLAEPFALPLFAHVAQWRDRCGLYILNSSGGKHLGGGLVRAKDQQTALSLPFSFRVLIGKRIP